MPPKHAATIYTEGDELVLSMPCPQGSTQTIRLPAHERGMATAIRLLREREHAYAKATPNSQPQFGGPAIPINYVVRKWLREDGKLRPTDDKEIAALERREAQREENRQRRIAERKAQEIGMSLKELNDLAAELFD